MEHRSRRETESEKGVKLHDVDPKPGDLSMARMKVGYNLLEVRTTLMLKNQGMSCG